MYFFFPFSSSQTSDDQMLDRPEWFLLEIFSFFTQPGRVWDTNRRSFSLVPQFGAQSRGLLKNGHI